MIIDCKLRPPSPSLKTAGFYQPGFVAQARGRRGYDATELEDLSVEQFLTEMADVGVGRAVVPGREADSGLGGSSFEELTVELGEHDEFVLAPPVPIAAVASGDATAVDRLFGSRPGAIVCEPGLYAAEPLKVDDRRLFEVYGAASAAGVPCFFLVGGSSGPTLEFAHPGQIDVVAAEFPNLKIVVSHAGWPHAAEMCAIVYRRANVWAMPDLYFPGMPGEQTFLECLRGVGRDRFLFGSGYPLAPLGEAVERYRRLPVGDDVIQQVLADNACELFSQD